MAAYGGTPATPIQSAKRVQSTPDNSSSKRRSNILGTPTPVTNTVSPLSNSHTPIRRRSVLPLNGVCSRRIVFTCFITLSINVLCAFR